jgi:precorrin-6Y C5,15-methyltransferase (decarboxylating)
MSRWLSIIGIGNDGMAGLSPAARTLVQTAEILVGGERHLAMVPAGPAERMPWRRPLTDTIPEIDAMRGRRVAVLASGDPLCYGVGVVLLRHFRRDEVTILPQPSAFSLAASRLGWDLADCTLLSLHARPLDALRLHLTPQRKLLLLSEDGSTPCNVARLLVDSGWADSRMTVFEHLGGAAESTRTGTAGEWGEQACASLNTIALECVASTATQPLSRLSGLPDDAFEHDGQLTKREVRAITLARLAPLPGELLWDVGAGCGSIAIEWLRALDAGTAIAVEREPCRAAMIARNAAALGVPSMEIVVGLAPDALAGLPPPDAVFVGGGISDPALMPTLWAALRPGGRLVANTVSTEGERAVLDWQASQGGELTRIAISRGEALGGYQGWRPLLGITQLVATKPL